MNELTLMEFNHVLYDIGKRIFNSLGTKDLKNCRQVCRAWRAAIDGRKYFWLRMIKVHNEKINLWKEVLNEPDAEKLRKFALAQKRYLIEIYGCGNPWHPFLMSYEAMPLWKYFAPPFKFGHNENISSPPLGESRSQFHFAIWFGNKDVFLSIWNKLSDEDKKRPDEHGLLPLQYAAEYGHVDVFRILFEASEDKDPRGKHGYSLLHIAADYGKFEIADYLLRSDFFKDKNPRDQYGRTAFHIAAREGHFTVCKILIEMASEKFPKDINGRVPLHIAAREGHLLICQLLLDPANIPVDNFQKTPYDLALQHDQHEVARLFSG